MSVVQKMPDLAAGLHNITDGLKSLTHFYFCLIFVPVEHSRLMIKNRCKGTQILSIGDINIRPRGSE